MSTLDTMLTEMMEETVRRAFLAGHERALTHGQQEAPAYGYEDWRGYGPGALLPGGSAASKAIRKKAAGEPPEWPQYRSRVEASDIPDRQTMTLETQHAGHTHIASVDLDLALAQAKGDTGYVMEVVARVLRALTAEVESCST